MIMKRFLNFLLLSAAVLSLGLMMASKPSADRKKDTKTPIYMNTSYSFQGKRMRGYFHYYVTASRIIHLKKKFL